MITLGVAVAACAFAAAASGGGSVKTNVVVTDVRYSSAGKLELLGELRSRNDACLRSRNVAVFKAVFDAEDDRKLGATEARRGSWKFTTRAVDRDDYVYAKARRTVVETDRGRVACKGGRSGDFLVGGE